MRNMSFMLTTEQVRNRTKTVTRRLGWQNLKPGELVRACVKCQGIRKGERMEKICVVRVVYLRLERLDRLITDAVYGRRECINEGFPKMSPEDFVKMFCETHDKCTPASIVTRIEFEYSDVEHGYGFFHGGDPRTFCPDGECCSEDEMKRHKAACKLWDEAEARGEEPTPEACPSGWIYDKEGKPLMHVLRSNYGIGSYTYEVDFDDPDWEARNR